MMRLIQFLVVILFCCPDITAQQTDFGVSLGGSVYSGDMDTPSLITNMTKGTSLAFGGFVRFNFTSKISLRTNFLYGKLKGDDANSTALWQINRNLDFQSRIIEIANLIEYNLFDITDNRNGKKWTPYINGGIAFLSFNPVTYFNSVRYELQEIGTEGQGLPGYPSRYGTNVFTIPVGGGIKYRINNKLTLQAELLARYTFTDYIDDISTEYVSVEDFLAAGRNLAADLSYRGDEIDPTLEFPPTGERRGSSGVKDYYGTAMISLYFNLEGLGDRNSRIKCPKFD